MKVDDLIKELERVQRQSGDDCDVVFMIHGCVVYAECNVVVDNDYDEIIIEINEQ